MTGSLIIISAPSGAGKTSLVNRLIRDLPAIQVSISHTTRKRRPGEENGVNYHFIDEPSFLEMQAAGEFIESAKVFNNYYGTSKTWVEDTLKVGVDVILEIDWQGAQQIRKCFPSVKSIFILPPSRSALESRLNDRGQDDPEIIQNRMAEAKSEISHHPEYDFIIVNDNFEQASHELTSVVTSLRLTHAKQTLKLEKLINDLMTS